jgi:hypothetical protein
VRKGGFVGFPAGPWDYFCTCLAWLAAMTSMGSSRLSLSCTVTARSAPRSYYGFFFLQLLADRWTCEEIRPIERHVALLKTAGGWSTPGSSDIGCSLETASVITRTSRRCLIAYRYKDGGALNDAIHVCVDIVRSYGSLFFTILLVLIENIGTYFITSSLENAMHAS